MYMVGVRKLTTYTDWFGIWMQLRLDAGIPWPQWPLYPARVREKWSNKAGRLNDFNLELKSLAARARVVSFHAIRSHSCKATLLGWCASFGVSMETRAALGYHKIPNDSSVRSYSRDRLQEPIRKLAEVLRAARDGSFLPDSGDKVQLADLPADVEPFEDVCPLVD